MAPVSPASHASHSANSTFQHATLPNASPLAHILVIESDVAIADVLKLELSYEGYQVNVASDGVTGLVAARTQNPDLIILSWSLPNIAGAEICQRLRSTGSTLPIIVLTAENQVSDRIASLGAGADDSLSRPFSLAELIARIRLHLRQHQRDAHELRFSDIVLNRKTHEVHRNGQKIELTAKEFDLLDYLMRHGRQVLSREQILENVWGYDFVGTVDEDGTGIY